MSNLHERPVKELMTKKSYCPFILIILMVTALALAVQSVLPHPTSVAAKAVSLGPLVNITQVVTGLGHTCTLTTRGGVKCWGANYQGQLGDGTNLGKNTPVAVSGLSSGVIAISAGGQFTCALMTGGGVKCWGWNDGGQLGDGTIVNRNTPVAVSGLSGDITAISAGHNHTCALTTSGTVKCWGRNEYGELGDGTTDDKNIPVDVNGLSSGITAISADDDHTCVLTTGGGVKCWGANHRGQLGDGTTDDKNTPVDVSGLNSRITAISTGEERTCALTTSGGVKCWGAPYPGQLGDGTTDDKNTPVDMSGLSSDIIAISTGEDHTCVLTTGGGVKCWGANHRGQLGAGTTDNKNTPVDVSGLSSGIIAISAGPVHTCALTISNSVKCWGFNDTGQLGNGITGNKITPIDVSGFSRDIITVSASAGEDHTCALTQSGGVKCWGLNNDGQLGDGTTDDKNTPVDVSSLSSGITAVSVGGYHTCALTTSGGVKCWGENENGQLGNGATGSKGTPVDVSGLTSGVIAISAGHDHTCALTVSGGVKCWGWNYEGELGDGTINEKNMPIDVNGLSSGIIAISAGLSHSCALATGGWVKCWGGNKFGELGDGTTDNKSTPVAVSGLSSDITAISTGGAFDGGHTCALTKGGGVKCWGWNEGGQLGDGTTINKNIPVDVIGLSSGIKAISAGGRRTCALTISGRAKCWGSRLSTPVDINGLSSGVVSISAGHNHTCVLMKGGRAKCWGANSAGQLGDGSAWRTTPADVMEKAM